MKRYSFVTVFILSMITCGFYFLHVISVISINNNAIAQRAKVKTIIGVVPAVVLSIVAAIALCVIGYVAEAGIFWVLAFVVPFVIYFVWDYQFCCQQCAILEAFGKKATPANNAVILFLTGFVPVYSYYVLCENYNLGVNASEGIV